MLQLTDLDEVDQLTNLPKLRCVYLEMNPMSEKVAYRGTVIRLLPQLRKLDATFCSVSKMIFNSNLLNTFFVFDYCVEKYSLIFLQ